MYLMNSREKEKDKYWVPPLNNSQKIQQYLKQKMAKLIMKQFMYEDTTQLILCIINIRQQDNRMPHPPEGRSRKAAAPHKAEAYFSSGKDIFLDVFKDTDDGRIGYLWK